MGTTQDILQCWNWKYAFKMWSLSIYIYTHFFVQSVHWQRNLCCSLVEKKSIDQGSTKTPKMSWPWRHERQSSPTKNNSQIIHLCFLLSRTCSLLNDRNKLHQKYMSKLGSSKPLAKNNQPVNYFFPTILEVENDHFGRLNSSSWDPFSIYGRKSWDSAPAVVL